MKEYPLQYASTDKNKKSHYNFSNNFNIQILLLYIGKCIKMIKMEKKKCNLSSGYWDPLKFWK